MERERPETTAASEASLTTRRALLLGGAAGLAGMTASLVVGAEPAGAANAKPVELGESNVATATTSVTNGDWVALLADKNRSCGIQGQDNIAGDTGFGVYGISLNGTGVYGQTSGSGGHAGVLGWTYSDQAIGVKGVDVSTGGGSGVYGESPNGVGVHGTTAGHGQSGVAGKDTSAKGGYGVSGSSVAGTGVSGTSTDAWGVYGSSTGGTGVHGTTAADGQSGVTGADTSRGGGHGVYGTSSAGVGIYGETSGSAQHAVEGHDASVDGGTAVYGGSTRGYGVLGISNGATGVEGRTFGDGSTGVYGLDASTKGGTGVYAESTAGTGLYASSTSGTALDVKGPVRFSTSGVATVPKGASKVEVTLAGVTAASLILATPQAEAAGIYVGSAVPGAGSFTINLSGTVTNALDVAWFVIG